LIPKIAVEGPFIRAIVEMKYKTGRGSQNWKPWTGGGWLKGKVRFVVVYA